LTRLNLKGYPDIIYAGNFESVRKVDEPNKSKVTIRGHAPKVPSTQMERGMTTLRSNLQITIARHAQTTSLRKG
jgi:hypothetical protein